MIGFTITLAESALNIDWIWALVVLALIALVMFIPRMKRRRGATRSEPFERESRRTADRIQLSLEKLMVELFDMSRDINAQLDTRMAALQQLLREADEKIAAMRQSLEDGKANAGAEPNPPAKNATETRPPKPASRIVQLPNGEPLLKTATASDPQHQDIYRLADEGQTLTEIARHTGRPVGEVQLILDLRRAGGAAQHDD